MIETKNSKSANIIEEIFGDMENILEENPKEDMETIKNEAKKSQQTDKKLLPISIIKKDLEQEKIDDHEIVEAVKETIDEIYNKTQEIINKKLTKKILIKVLERIE